MFILYTASKVIAYVIASIAVVLMIGLTIWYWVVGDMFKDDDHNPHSDIKY